jgi:uncharacterized protein (DUF4415 family)
MNENKHAFATDLKKLDAHVVQPAEYEDAPELTDEQLAEANVHEGGKLVRRGRPPSVLRKQPVKLRLDTNVLESFRATGPGWQTLMNAVLLRVALLTPRARVAFGRLDPSELDAVMRAILKVNKAATRRSARQPARSTKTHQRPRLSPVKGASPR